MTDRGPFWVVAERDVVRVQGADAITYLHGQASQDLAAMAVGRAKRVLLLALAIRLGGERAERLLHKWIEPVGWFVVVLVLVLIGFLFLRK